MTQEIEIPFVKYHALGNDFIVLSGRDLFRILSRPSRQQSTKKAAENAIGRDVRMLARSICAGHIGIGADGLLVMLSARDRHHQGSMLVFNADGSEVEMSGNGIRCAAAYLLENAKGRRASSPSAVKRASRLRSLQIETRAGVKSLKLIAGEKGRWIFEVGMGTPIFEPMKIPFLGSDFPSPIVGFPLRTSRGLMPVTVSSMGNPHCTVFVADFAAIDWANLGREIESSDLFPRRTNVEFVKVVSRREIEVRFWERGVGTTMSSGTGSSAAVIACILNGQTDRNVRVRTLAGTLRVAWLERGDVTLTGPVERIARGRYYPRRQGMRGWTEASGSAPANRH